MAENSNIQWTDHTFNPWRGCKKVAAGCQHCYADELSKRNPGTLGIWGSESSGATRVLASEWMWREPVKQNRRAEAMPGKIIQRPRVFCASLADVFEDWQGPLVNSRGERLFRSHPRDKHKPGRRYWIEEPHCAGGECLVSLHDVRRRLFRLIDRTPNLDWLVLTKRPENIQRMLPIAMNGRDPSADDYMMRDNLWFGTSVACQEDADRNIPELLKCRDLARVLFVSAEPLVGPVDLSQWLNGNSYKQWANGGGGTECPHGITYGILCRDCQKLDWVIVGGESGPKARPCDVEWIRSIIRQCGATGVPCFVKQLGANVHDGRADGGIYSNICDEECWPDLTVNRWMINGLDPALHGGRCHLVSNKGGDPQEWPPDLRVQQFPLKEDK